MRTDAGAGGRALAGRSPRRRLPVPGRRGVRLVLALFVALLPFAPGGPARAGEDAPAERWTFEKRGVEVWIEVGGLDPAVSAALARQLEAQGWRRVGGERQAPAADEPGSAVPPPPPPPGTPAAPKEGPAGLGPEALKDIEELIRGGGRFPAGWRPNALRGAADAGAAGPAEGADRRPVAPGAGPGPAAAPLALGGALGRLILEALSAREDPVRGPVYEALLRDVAGALVALSGPGTRLEEVLAGLGARLLNGLADPVSGPIYRRHLGEVLEALGQAAPGSAAGATASPGPASAPSEPAPAPAQGAGPGALLGARVTFLGPLLGGPGWRFDEVPPGSLAEQLGLRPGDVLVSVDGVDASPAARALLAETVRARGQLTLGVRRKEGHGEVLDAAFE